MVQVAGNANRAPHEFYVSICYIRNLEQGLEVHYRIFKDDLDAAVGSTHEDYCRVVSEYVLDHFSLHLDGMEVQLGSPTCKKEGDGQLTTYTCILKANPITNPSILRVRSTVLLDVLDDQVNMIHYIDPQGRRSVNLDYQHTTSTIDL